MITIIDAIPGQGKTQWAIQYLINRPYDRFLFITPFLNEVERVKSNCPNFCEPKEIRGSKSRGLLRLIKQGKRIASTHALFGFITKEILEEIKKKNYILILDEVFNVSFPIALTSYDANLLINTGMLKEKEDGVLKWNSAWEYRGVFDSVKDMATRNRLIRYGSSIQWEMPFEIFFNVFSKIYVLTYLFEGQVQSFYFKKYGLPYTKNSVINTKDGFALVDYDVKNEIHIRKGLYNLIEFDKDIDRNRIGKDSRAFSLSWYERGDLEKVKRFTQSFFRTTSKAKSNECLWTTFLDYKDSVTPHGYKKSFIVHNLRATNMFGDRTHCAYLVNRYLRPDIKVHFGKFGIKCNEGDYAVSEIIQWLFRSAIRNDKPIKAYIPSIRMKELLYKWSIGE